MLWFLKQDPTREIPSNAQGNKDTVFYINSQNEYTIGRGECNLTLPNDQSVSRKHAAVWLENGTIKLKDLSSRYGSFVNPDSESKAITANEPVTLEQGAKIRFGMQWNIWELHCVPIRTILANMPPAQKDKISSTIQSLNGTIKHVVADNCTHITSDVIYLTLKLLWGLVKGLPIVTPKYWVDCVEKVKSNKQLPDCKNYVPKVGEDVLEKEHINVDPRQRRELFKNKRFLFTNERRLSKLQQLVEIAGGECGILTDLNDVIKPNTIVVNPLEDKPSAEVVAKLQEVGRRLIPEHEIALAIWYCSCNTNCNPEYTHQLIKDVTFVEQNDDILVQETEPSSQMEGTQVVINPSQEEQMEVSSSTDTTTRKRVIDDFFTFEVPKRQKIEVKPQALLMPEKKYPSLDEIHFSFATNKRKADEMEDAEESKSKRHQQEPWKPSETIINLDPEIIDNIYNVNGWITKSFVKMELKEEEDSILENGEKNGQEPILENGEQNVSNNVDEKKDIKPFDFKPMQVKILPSILVKTESNGDHEVTIGGVNFKKFKKCSVRKASCIVQTFTRRVCDGQQSKSNRESDHEDDSATTGAFGTDSQFNMATPCA